VRIVTREQAEKQIAIGVVLASLLGLVALRLLGRTVAIAGWASMAAVGAVSLRLILRLPTFPQKRALLVGGPAFLLASGLLALLMFAVPVARLESWAASSVQAGLVVTAYAAVCVFVIATLGWGYGGLATVACLLWLRVNHEERSGAIEETAAEWERNMRKPGYIVLYALLASALFVFLSWIALLFVTAAR
jgi:hypothetical protein